MAIKQAAMDKIFTAQELKQMDPQMVERIKTGIEFAILKAGGKVANPTDVEERFEALKGEALGLRPPKLHP